jgi:imidazolonepropionase-like amidohydrolase
MGSKGRSTLAVREVTRLVALCLLLAAPMMVAGQERLALVGGTAITIADARPLEDAVILLRDGRIEQLGARRDVQVPDDYRVVDVKGQWITPGLIDSNVHLILMTVPEFFVKYEDDLEEIAIQSAQVGLKYGMTTMADSWGPLDPLKRARDRINSGEITGSRVLIAGNIVGLGGPFSSYFMGSWDLRGISLRYGGWVHPMIQQRIDKLWEAGGGPELLAMTPNEAADAMRAYIAQGVDFVKVAVSAHGIGPVEPMMFSPRVLQAMRQVVREAGIPFQTHSFTVESLRASIDLEPDLLQHPNVMSTPWQYASEAQKSAIREMIVEIADKGILSGLMAIPNREQIRIYAEWDSSQHDDPWINQIMDFRKGTFVGADFEQLSEGVKVWLDADVPFTIATDQGPEAADLGPVVWGRLGRAHFDRMEALQEIGASPQDILVAATRNGAAAYGLEDRLGTIEAGKVADLLVLGGDPLADVVNLRKIRYVIKDGRIVDRESLPTVKVLDYDPAAAWPQ